MVPVSKNIERIWIRSHNEDPNPRKWVAVIWLSVFAIRILIFTINLYLTLLLAADDLLTLIFAFCY